MKAVIKLLIAPALAVALVSAAHANDIVLGSYGSSSGTNAGGFANTPLLYVNYDANSPASTGSLTGTTYDLTSGLAPWSPAISSSQWVSEDPNSTVGSGSVPPNGYYTYTSTFSADPGTYGGSISFLGDDTLQFYLNGNLIVQFKDNSQNGACAQGPGPGATCVGDPYTYTFGLPVDLLALNTITVVDWQSNLSAAGLDFEGTLTETPEPGSLLLLGTGLVGLAKLIARKRNLSA